MAAVPGKQPRNPSVLAEALRAFLTFCLVRFGKKLGVNYGRNAL
jgi:hypothetical protein